MLLECHKLSIISPGPDLMLTEESLHGAPAPVLHGGGQTQHRDLVDPQEVAHKDAPEAGNQATVLKDTPFSPLALAAEPGQGTDVVCDHHEGGPGQVLLGGPLGPLLNAHLAKARGHDITKESKPATGVLDTYEIGQFTGQI